MCIRDRRRLCLFWWAAAAKPPGAVKTQAAAKTMSAIPQTSDDMPVTALTVIALAALLGLGVTVVMKRKHE